MDIRQFSISEHIDKVGDLVRSHWQETEPGLTDDGPAPCIASYEKLEKLGCTIAFGAFDGDEMVGYCVAFTVPHLHYGFMYAQHDVFYLRPDHRKGSLALRLIRLTEQAAKERGARFIAWHAKPDSKLNKILSRTGYVVEEVVFKKEL